MAEIRPFQALIYNQERIPDIRKVVTPPYDVISPSDQERYYQLSPYNIIRLVFGKEYPQDNEFKNKYCRAANFLEGWQKEGVLKRLPKPAIYIYGLDYRIEDRNKQALGFISLVRLEEFDSGSVLPHEKTFAGPKADRLRLMQACKANLDQVFSIYGDEPGQAHAILSKEVVKEPLMAIEDDDRVLHRIWAVIDQEPIKRLTDILTDKSLFIADGHHRYETALNYARWRRHQEASPSPEAPYNFIPMLLIDVANEDLTIMPTHRLLMNLGGLTPDDFLKQLGKFFTVERRLNLNDLSQTISSKSDRHIFGLYLGSDDCYSLTLINENIIDEYLPDNASAEWKNLDAALLQYAVLGEVLGLKDQGHGVPDKLQFTEKKEEAAKAVDRHEAAAVIFMNPTRMEQVVAVARNRETMPQKSTYFYPKPLTGLIMNIIEE